LASSTRNRDKKSIGDATSITIPKEFQDWITGEKRSVTEEQIKLINAALSKRGFVHLVMTGITLVEENLKDIKSHNIGHKMEQVANSVSKIETLVRGLYESKKVD